MKKLLITFVLLSCLSAHASVRSVLAEHNKALKNHDIEKVKTFYSKDYKSADGFDIDDLEAMLEKTYNSYKNIKYKTKINSITMFDNYAIAQVTDKTSAILTPDKKDKSKTGYLEGKSVYSVYLKNKGDDDWEIFYDDILMEETSLKYGIANKINMNLNTPLFIKKGEQYDISLKMDKPQDVVALGSLSREEITYPPKDYEEKFRKIPETGDLERLVRANKSNLDEYAVASVGFTKILVNEQETRARIEVLGMAYIMKRINMKNVKELKEELVENN